MHWRRGTARVSALDKAMQNGYNTLRYQRRPTTGRPQAGSRGNKIPLCMPFISDNVTAAIQRSIVQARGRLQNEL